MNVTNIWYDEHPLSIALVPFSWLFCASVWLRRQAYKYELLSSYHAPVPVIVVGNLSVGGTGKTPLVLWLSQFLKQHGYKPGIVSRGYGGHAQKWPQLVSANSTPNKVGDEPVLLAQRSKCPIVVAPKRFEAVQTLLKNYACNIIISDDGLQHYALHRDIEIVLIDATRQHGNQRCLPAGPLREPINRLKQADFLITSNSPNEFTIHNLQFAIRNYSMQYKLKPLRQVTDDNISQSLIELHGQTVHAVAGIGNPAKFFAHLQEHGLNLYWHEFPDHHRYQPSDIQFADNLAVIMTEKDAVKCREFANCQHWYLPIEASLPNTFGENLLYQLEEIQNG